MAQTVTFNGAAFDILNTSGGGTNALAPQASDYNSANGAPSYTFRNSNNSAINGLGFQDNSSAGINIAISSRGKDSALNSTLTFGNARDTLVIGSSTNNKFFMGDGDNTAKISYRSTNDVINVGNGSDTIIFGQSVNNSLVQLTTDTSVDTIRLSTNTNPTNLKITGATDIDVLFIGSTQYNYQSSTNLWVNQDNSMDTKNFS
jgi:hypothetical protein